MTALSDFETNLEGSDWVKLPVEIIDSQVDHNAQTGELVRFTVKANVNDPHASTAPAPGRGNKPTQ